MFYLSANLQWFASYYQKNDISVSADHERVRTAKPLQLRVFTVSVLLFSHNKASTMPLFHNLNLLTLNDVFKLEIAKVMHNIENNERLLDNILKNFE